MDGPLFGRSSCGGAGVDAAADVAVLRRDLGAHDAHDLAADLNVVLDDEGTAVAGRLPHLGGGGDEVLPRGEHQLGPTLAHPERLVGRRGTAFGEALQERADVTGD